MLIHLVVLLVTQLCYRVAKHVMTPSAPKLVRAATYCARSCEDMALYMEATQSYNRKYWRRRHPFATRICFLLSAISGTLALSWCDSTPVQQAKTCPTVPIETKECPTVHHALSVQELIGVPIESCLAPMIASEGEHCYTIAEPNVWQRPTKNVQYTVLPYGTVASGNVIMDEAEESRGTPQRKYFVDYNGDFYFTSLATRPDQSTAPVLIKESHLCKILDSHVNDIDQKHVVPATLSGEAVETRDHDCVCPDALGLHDNLSFLHYHDMRSGKRQWIVMTDPALVTTPPVSGIRRIRTTIPRRAAGDSKSTTTPRYETVEHPDQLLVSFTEPLFKFGEHAASHERMRLMEYNNRLNEENKTFIVLKRVSQSYQSRVSVTLSGSAAQCFIYCQYPYRLVPV